MLYHRVMTGHTRTVHWERLAALRSPFFLLAGLAFLCVAAFLSPWSWLGWAAVGLSLLVAGALMDAPVSEEVRR
jgi:hypothetical protein